MWTKCGATLIGTTTAYVRGNGFVRGGGGGGGGLKFAIYIYIYIYIYINVGESEEPTASKYCEFLN